VPHNSLYYLYTNFRLELTKNELYFYTIHKIYTSLFGEQRYADELRNGANFDIEKVFDEPEL
jgi:hypothetical protein